VIPYWIALSMAVFGDHPVAWKLALFPFALGLTAALAGLLRRFASGLEVPLLWLAVLSPPLLPNFNLMLDVPALALGLGALELFIRACDRNRHDFALVAGLLGALSMQTKYTGIVFVLAMLVYGGIFARWRILLVAALTTGSCWIGWEAFVELRYGTSQFSDVAAIRGSGTRTPTGTLLALLSVLGATLPALGLLALASLGVRARWLAAAAAIVSVPFTLLPALPRAEISSDLFPGGGIESRVELLVFTILGLLVASAIATAVGSLAVSTLRRHRLLDRDSGPGEAGGRVRWRASAFLISWFGIALSTVPLLSPFFASRRMLSLAVASLFLIGHVATHTADPHATRRRIAWVAAWGVALGALFAIADFSDALARRRSIAVAERRLESLGADRSEHGVWFTGHWGFQFYAERGGMRPVVPGGSRLARGDWLLVPSGVKQQQIAIAPRDLAWVEQFESASSFPWSTIPSAYLGRLPLRPQPQAQIRVDLYRAERDFVPAANGSKLRSRQRANR
jgi:hypothetical protein